MKVAAWLVVILLSWSAWSLHRIADHQADAASATISTASAIIDLSVDARVMTTTGTRVHGDVSISDIPSLSINHGFLDVELAPDPVNVKLDGMDVLNLSPQ